MYAVFKLRRFQCSPECATQLEKCKKGNYELAPTWEFSAMRGEGYSHLGYWSTFCVCDVIWAMIWLKRGIQNWRFSTIVTQTSASSTSRFCLYIVFPMQIDLLFFFGRAVSWLIAGRKTFYFRPFLHYSFIIWRCENKEILVEIAHLTLPCASWFESFEIVKYDNVAERAVCCVRIETLKSF